ncbi:hypothetical protein KIPB_013048, partial [Kipferlia bialata]|eukprot:g13048.t1
MRSAFKEIQRESVEGLASVVSDAVQAGTEVETARCRDLEEMNLALVRERAEMERERDQVKRTLAFRDEEVDQWRTRFYGETQRLKEQLFQRNRLGSAFRPDLVQGQMEQGDDEDGPSALDLADMKRSLTEAKGQ